MIYYIILYGGGSLENKKFNNTEKSNLKTMAEGNPLSIILTFSIPMLIGNIFQQLYNMVDSIVVGNYVGKIALAAVGTGFPIIFMMSAMFIGIGMGATVLISQFFGADDIDNVKRTIKTIYTALVIAIIPISVLGVLLSEPILRLINTPADTLPMAKQYMVIIFAGLIGGLGFNINSGILQGLGDSKSSLLFLVISSLLNIILDLIFVLIFHLAVAGVAYATIIAQIFSWIFGIIYMRKKYGILDISFTNMEFDKNIFKNILKLGLPTGVQQALFSVGIMSLQSLVNSYGSDFIAGFNVANKLDTFAFMPIQSFSNAMTTYTGQNIGAGRIDRVRKGMVSTMFLSIGFSIGAAIFVIPMGPLLLRLFNNDAAVVHAGMIYLKNVMPFFSLLAVVFILNSVIRGAGESVIPMIGSIVSLWLGRLPAAYYIAYNFGKEYMFVSYAVGWLFWLIITGPYYLSGKWKSKSEKLINKI